MITLRVISMVCVFSLNISLMVPLFYIASFSSVTMVDEWYKTFSYGENYRGSGARSFIQVDDGYVIFGNIGFEDELYSDVWLVKTDFDGNYAMESYFW